MASEFKTMQGLIYDKLKDGIIFGVYQPGMRLIVSDLASEFNISKMPVREALTRLGSTGLVELVPYMGRLSTILRLKIMSKYSISGLFLRAWQPD